MKPARPEGANKVWTQEGEALPCEVCGGDGSDECPGCWGSGRAGDQPIKVEGDAVTSAWQPNTGERKALANGAPIILYVTKEPPSMQVTVGEPSVVVRPLLDGRHVEAALLSLMAELRLQYSYHMEIGGLPDDEDILKQWHKTLVANTPSGSSLSSRRGAG